MNFHRTTYLAATTAMAGPRNQPDYSELDKLLMFLSMQVESLEKRGFKTTGTKDARARSMGTRRIDENLLDRPHRYYTTDPQSKMLFLQGDKQQYCQAALPVSRSIRKSNVYQIRCFRCTLSGDQAKYCRRTIGMLLMVDDMLSPCATQHG